MASTQTDIQTVFDRYVAAVKASDAQAMLSLYSDDVHVFDLMGGWEHHGVDAWRQTVEEWLGDQSMEQGCSLADLTIIEEGNLAVVRAMINYEYTKDGEQDHMWNRGTWALRRIDGDWKIVVEHTSVPLDDKSMQPLFKREA